MSRRFEMQYEIHPEMLEAQYQHLHHADVLRVLEQARVQFLADLGLPQEELLEKDCFLVLAKSEIQFFREIKADSLRCRVKLLAFQGESGFSVEQEIFKFPTRLAVRASFELVAMSGVTRRRRPLPEELRTLLNGIED